MKEPNKLALYVAYYLSKFDDLAYNKLNFGKSGETHNVIGKILGVKPGTVKNMRDEFDPIHSNGRAGWYQRPISPSRLQVIRALEDLDEPSVYSLVKKILNTGLNKEEIHSLLSVVSEEDKGKNKEGVNFSSARGVTGRQAEEVFREYYAKTKIPINGVIKDTRDDGCGYDFLIKADKDYYIEVKGISKEIGGILLTKKEWEVAHKAKEQYILAIVSNLNKNPKLDFISNPANKLDTKLSIYSILQVQHTVSAESLKEFLGS